ncbi:response regulator transcription factor [Chitinophaga silvisoli]|uniref:LuxR family transcriptional regulator n=1 Tax=Chitinophaga silvisoli TaxID=2291814 RepID=A0A3E1NWX3_9BACT|nr:helix-turn-helix transcriptional regulator [Chitinophaga silvisoli]RFM32415.1 LuxR family transcriptional regulator [Chitinophaga silvisoli]
MRIKDIARQHGPIIKFGILTGLAVISFELINLFVLYRQIKLDYYLSVIAVTFLIAGIWISRERVTKNAPKPVQPAPDYQLTAKELEVLALIASGKANKEIAASLYVEMSTVKTHINNIYNKLSVKNRKEAKDKYLEINGITP